MPGIGGSELAERFMTCHPNTMHIEITEYYENSELKEKEIFITAKRVRSKRRKLSLSIVEIAQNIVKAISSSSSYIGS